MGVGQLVRKVFLYGTFTVLGCFKVQISSYLPSFQDDLSVPFSRVLDVLTLEDGTDGLSRNVRKY